jgi:hypothetical protein
MCYLYYIRVHAFTSIVAVSLRVYSFGPKQEVRVSPSWLEVRPHVC